MQAFAKNCVMIRPISSSAISPNASTLFERAKRTPAKSEILSYDALGRVLKSKQTIGTSTFQFGTALQNGYEYTSGDGLKSIRYPSGSVVTTGFHNNGWAKTASGLLDGQSKNYIEVSGIIYHPHGGEKTIPYGNTVVETRNYNSRLQASGVRAERTGLGLLVGIQNDYGSGLTLAQNNGNVRTQTIEPGSASPITQTFGYDALNRLDAFSESGSVYENYGYDQWGNRWVSATGGLQTEAKTPTVQGAFDARNRLSTSYSAFDEAGNQTYDAPYSLIYDAENRLVSATSGGNNNASYSYDGEGRRVKTVVNGLTTIFVHDAFGNLVAEYGGLTSGSVGTTYVTQDHLGSTRMTTDGTGGNVRRFDYRPFGGLMAVPDQQGACGTARATLAGYCADGPRTMFTGQQRDAETGLDYFNARYLATVLGRFGVPDEPMIAQKASDPQSWNLFSYVLNNPLIFTDPSGREPCQNGINPENGNICTVVSGLMPKPDIKLDSPLFFALARGINNSRTSVETAAVATGIVAALPILAGGTVVVIDGVAYTWEALLALGPEALAKLAAAGKIGQELWNRIVNSLPQLAWKGGEVVVGKNLRINLTGDWVNIGVQWFGRLPHYHRRIVDAVSGNTIPGGGMKYHRHWESPSVGGFWRRF